jgi:hypothetical protein
MKKEKYFLIIIVALISTVCWCLQQEKEIHDGISNLTITNIDAIAEGEVIDKGHWVVIYNPIGHDCFKYGDWCCPGLDCK